MVQTSETIRKDNPQKALQEEDEVTAKAKAAFAEIRAMAERGEFPEMTLDEINEEIREVRRLRKERINGLMADTTSRHKPLLV